MSVITTTRVNTFNLRFDLKAGSSVNKTWDIIVFRVDTSNQGEVKTEYSVWLQWQIWEHLENEPIKKIGESKDRLEFSDYFEADSKYQALCIKAFADSMSNRQVY